MTNNESTLPGLRIMLSCDFLFLYSNINLTECGNAILDRYEFSADTSFAVGWNFLAMGIFLGTFIILGFVGLLASTRRK